MSDSRTAWHARPEDLAAYGAGQVGEVQSASLETHLVRCGVCRETMSGLTPAADSDRRWERLVDVVDRPTPTLAERWGLGRWARGTTARVTWAAPTMRTAWVACVVVVALLPLLAAEISGLHTSITLLAMAPLAPVAAVALAYGTTADPAGELAAAAPRAGLRLVAQRALAVTVAAIPLGVGAGLLAGVPVLVALAWVLPGLALAALVLAVGTTRWDPTPVAVAAAGAWALAVGLPAPVWGVAARTVAATVAGPGVQGLSLAAAVTALLVTVARRDAIAYRRTR